jgi:hypothetical protein
VADRSEIRVCQICGREYKFDDRHHCLDQGFGRQKVKTFPEKSDPRALMVKISDPAMEWHEVDLNALLACCRRELAFRQRCYPRWVDKGTLSEKRAEKELALMQQLVDFMGHCVFKAVTQRRTPAA